VACCNNNSCARCKQEELDESNLRETVTQKQELIEELEKQNWKLKLQLKKVKDKNGSPSTK